MKIEWENNKLLVGTESLQYITNMNEMFSHDSADGYIFSKPKKLVAIDFDKGCTDLDEYIQKNHSQLL